MRKMTQNSENDTNCRLCRQIIATITLPHYAAVNSNLYTRNDHEYHETLVGFIAAAKAPHF